MGRNLIYKGLNLLDKRKFLSSYLKRFETYNFGLFQDFFITLSGVQPLSNITLSGVQPLSNIALSGVQPLSNKRKNC